MGPESAAGPGGVDCGAVSFPRRAGRDRGRGEGAATAECPGRTGREATTRGTVATGAARPRCLPAGPAGHRGASTKPGAATESGIPGPAETMVRESEAEVPLRSRAVAGSLETR